MWDAHDGMGWWMVFGGLLWLALWAAVFYVAFALFGKQRGELDAFGTARRRYARGDISREEYERLTRDLSGPS